MRTVHPLEGTGWRCDSALLGPAFDGFLSSRRVRPRLLALGEPTHGDEAFLRVRNDVFWHLVEHGDFRSIALESDCLAGLEVDRFVRGGPGTLDDVMRTGFSHGFGDAEANRALVAWMRDHNDDRDERSAVRFYGFDAPMEITGAESPRRSLLALHRFLAAHLPGDRLPCSAERIAELAGADERWSDPAAVTDPARSVGASDAAVALRLVADDLRGLLAAEAPRLLAAGGPDGWWRAGLHGRTAAGLLRYHAAMADDRAPAARISRLSGLRDAMMADNLRAIVEREAERGPTLVFAHNGHLQRPPSRWRWGDLSVEWWSAGATVSAQLGPGYAFVATAVGSAAHLGLDAPEPTSVEGLLSDLPGDQYLLDARALAEVMRSIPEPAVRDTSAIPGYAPLDAGELADADGVLFLKRIP